MLGGHRVLALCSWVEAQTRSVVVTSYSRACVASLQDKEGHAGVLNQEKQGVWRAGAWQLKKRGV